MHTLIETIRKSSSGEHLLYGISNRLGCCELDPLYYMALLFQTGAHLLQWREKDQSPRECRKFVRLGVKLSRQTGKLFLVNSRIELACEEGAHGVHLTSQQDPADVVQARSRVGAENFLVGKSVHGVEEAIRAVEDGVDYLLAGPIFPPLSKPSFLSPLGTDVLARIVRESEIPVFALGGIRENVSPDVWATGAIGVAGISWLRREIEALAG